MKIQSINCDRFRYIGIRELGNNYRHTWTAVSSRFLETRTIANTHHKRVNLKWRKFLPLNIRPGAEVFLEFLKIGRHFERR